MQQDTVFHLKWFFHLLVWIRWDMITSQITHGRTIIMHKPFQKSLPYKEEVMYLFIVDQYCKDDMDSEVFSKVLLECHAIIETNLKICLDYGLEVLQDVAEGENVKTSPAKGFKIHAAIKFGENRNSTQLNPLFLMDISSNEALVKLSNKNDR